MAETNQSVSPSASYEEQLKSANEIVYKHSLELARLTKELAAANAAQENLLHFISHEVKGYLTKSEAAFAAIVQGDYGDVSGELLKMAAAALEDVRKGVETVMGILEASNLKKGTVAFKKEKFDFKALVEKVITEQRPAAYEKRLGLDLSIEPGEYLYAGDEAKMHEHVIRNLVDNSIKYTPSGTVKVELSRKDNAIRFVVQDTGVGITPEDKVNLFTEGGHGKDSIKVNVHSTGYGLYIAKQIVEAHGGKISAESEGQGKGSKFIVELPTT